MTRVLIAGAILSVGGMWADYASAAPSEAACEIEALVASERCVEDSVCIDRAVSEHEECLAFVSASADVARAPEWCEVTYVERDMTHGWRAVCVLAREDGAS